MTQRAKPIIVKNWTTEAGLPAMVLKMPLGFHCGYVGVGENHPAFGKDYEDTLLWDIDVHGGLTYANKPPQKDDSAFWAFGYDCAHAGDLIPGSSGPDAQFLQMFDSLAQHGDVFRDLDFCVDQCERLATQLQALAEPKRLPPPNDWLEDNDR